ncbi:hypothetical protein EVAR_74278_1 [Eumeta japonica]|uniref:Uncharacterized protein n=1 Tax=Eumeta variegata TaxID=151549 RepID=A0A4C1SDH7_EUMVA|nr:hypothetical protein EVAR_74278_1 [Eumeta japonica]
MGSEASLMPPLLRGGGRCHPNPYWDGVESLRFKLLEGRPGEESGVGIGERAEGRGRGEVVNPAFGSRVAYNAFSISLANW